MEEYWVLMEEYNNGCYFVMYDKSRRNVYRRDDVPAFIKAAKGTVTGQNENSVFFTVGKGSQAHLFKFRRVLY